MEVNDISYMIYQFEGGFYSLHQKLLKVRDPLQKKEERSYKKRVSKHFSSFLDQRIYDQYSISKADIESWVIEFNQDIAQKDIDQISSWIYPLSSDKFLINFYNLKEESKDKLVKALKLMPYSSAKKSIPLDVIRNGYCFKLYYPGDVTVMDAFKYLPSLEHRINSLAQDSVGNDWLVSFPERQWKSYLWQMLGFLKSSEGKEAVATRALELKKLKFITDLTQAGDL